MRESRATRVDWYEAPPGILWQLLFSAVAYGLLGAHLYTSISKPWPAPKKTLAQAMGGASAARHAKAMADYKAGRQPELSADDLPEGMALFYLLLGVGGYALVCSLFHPQRVLYAGLLAAFGLLCAHHVK